MHTVKLRNSYKIKKASKLQNAPPGSLAPHHGAGSQAPSPSCQEASGRTTVLVTVRIRNRLSHQPGADGYVNGEQFYSTFLCPKHEQRSWDLGAVWKLNDKSQKRFSASHENTSPFLPVSTWHKAWFWTTFPTLFLLGSSHSRKPVLTRSKTPGSEVLTVGPEGKRKPPSTRHVLGTECFHVL